MMMSNSANAGGNERVDKTTYVPSVPSSGNIGKSSSVKPVHSGSSLISILLYVYHSVFGEPRINISPSHTRVSLSAL